MSSSSSNDTEDQITMTFLDVMEQVMSILVAEEVVFSLTPWSKCRQRYVNRDHKVAHFML
jgi:hypothetical protein